MLEHILSGINIIISMLYVVFTISWFLYGIQIQVGTFFKIGLSGVLYYNDKNISNLKKD